MAVIYKATNKINGKAYIGYDSKWPNRMKSHLRHASQGKGYAFQAAIAEYGEENFVWEILKEDASYDDEVFLIEQHDTFGVNGYNMTPGGEGATGNKYRLGIPFNEEVKKHLSELGKLRTFSNEEIYRFSQLRTGTSNSKEHNQKFSEARKKQIFSIETRQKMSNSAKGNCNKLGKRKHNFSKG